MKKALPVLAVLAVGIALVIAVPRAREVQRKVRILLASDGGSMWDKKE